MKRILYFHHAIGMGGAPRSLSMLIAGLDRSRFEPIVAMPRRPGNEAVKSLFVEAGAQVIEKVPIRPFNGSEVAPCRTLSQKAYSLAAFPLLSRLARQLAEDFRPDIVHLNSTCLVAAARGVTLSNCTCPTIAHVREPLLFNRWGRLLARLNRKYVDYFIAIDEAGLASIGENRPNGVVIRNFVDLKSFRPDAEVRRSVRDRHGWRAEDIIFLLLSRISESNGVLPLLDLVESVDRDLASEAKFVIAGFEKYGTAYADEARERIDAHHRCEALPFTHNVSGLLNAVDVVVAPYLTSHSARSVFEGGAVGRPALVTRHPNLLEQIEEGETGIAFDLDDPAQFTNAVNRLCHSTERVGMGAKARDFARANYSAEANIAKTQDVYRRLLSA